MELKFQLKLLRIKTNIRIGILHIVEKKKHFTFPLNTSSCLGLGAGRKNNLTDNLTIKNSSLRINKHEPVRFIRLSGLQAYLHDGWKLFFFLLYGWFDSQGGRASLSFGDSQKSQAYGCWAISLPVVVYFCRGVWEVHWQSTRVPALCWTLFLSPGTPWLFGKHLTEDEEAAEWEGVLKCEETSKLLMRNAM